MRNILLLALVAAAAVRVSPRCNRVCAPTAVKLLLESRVTVYATTMALDGGLAGRADLVAFNEANPTVRYTSDAAPRNGRSRQRRPGSRSTRTKSLLTSTSEAAGVDSTAGSLAFSVMWRCFLMS